MIFIDVALGLGGDGEGSNRLFERKAVRNQPGQVVSLGVSLEDDAQRFVLNLYRGAVGTKQRLLVHAYGGGIDGRLPVLGLRKQQHAAPRARRIHRGADQSIAGRGQDNGVGSPALAGRADRRHHVFPRSIDRRIEPEAGRHGVPLRIKIRREHLGRRTLGKEASMIPIGPWPITSTVSSAARFRLRTPLRQVFSGSTKTAWAKGTPSGIFTNPRFTIQSMTRTYPAKPPPEGSKPAVQPTRL